MNKAFYIAIIVASGLSMFASSLRAQFPNVDALPIDKDRPQYRGGHEASLEGGMRVSFWNNDFSDCNEWLIDNALDNGFTQFVDLQFECGTEVPEGFAPIDAIASTTADNGYMMVDSDEYGGEEGGTGIENCWFQTVQPINCSAHPFVSISFETFYYMWDGGGSDGNEYCLLEVSRDGVTWPDLNTFEVAQGFVDFGDGDGPVQARWELWPEMQTQDPVANPTVKIFEISSAAGGQETIWIRFRWKGTWGYSWMVDDVELFDTPENDLALVGYQSYTDYETSGIYEYGIWPSSQSTQIPMAATVANLGVNTQNGVSLSTFVNGSPAGTSPQINLAPQTSQILQVSGYSVPTTVGAYNVEFLAEPELNDDIPENNSSTTSFEVSEFTFARDNGVFSGEFPGPDYNDEFIAAVPYQFFGNGNIHAVQVAITSGEANTPMICHILDEGLEIVASSDELQLNTSFLNDELDNNDIQWYTFVFDDPWFVNSGELFMAAFHTYGGGNIRIGEAQDVPDQTSFVFADFGMQGYEWYFTSEVGMVRFSLDPNAQNTADPISGCPDPLACNYQPNPDILEACTYPGCDDPVACNYDPTAGCNDGSCLTFDACGDCGGNGIAGCTDSTACNFNPNATCADFSCSYPGCTDFSACNYDPSAGCNDGSCLTFDACGDCGGNGIAGCTDSTACNFNPNATCADFSCSYPGCTDFSACNYDPSAGCDDGSCTFTPEIEIEGLVVVGTFTSSEYSIQVPVGADIEWDVTGGAITSPNGQAGVSIFWGDEGVGSICASVSLDSCPTQTDCINVVIAPDNAVPGCTNSSACNYNPNATTDNGSCIFVGDACDDGDANTINDSIQANCECAGEDPNPSTGCTDPEACNYSPEATTDDGSCFFVGDPCNDGDPETTNDTVQANCDCLGETINDVLGCMSPNACNFNADATLDDGSCIFVGDACDDGDANTINDSIQANCECAGEDPDPSTGCTEPEACNYSPEATTDDGSCEYVELYTITGSLTPELFTSEVYTYQETAGSTYQWSTTLGAITAGQGTNEASVTWGTQGTGQLCVTETREDGCSGEEVCQNIVVLPTDIEEQEGEAIVVYPNPASVNVTVSVLSSWLTGEYEVVDLQGRVVLQGTVNRDPIVLDVSGLTSGRYELVIRHDDKLVLHPLVIQK